MDRSKIIRFYVYPYVYSVYVDRKSQPPGVEWIFLQNLEQLTSVLLPGATVYDIVSQHVLKRYGN